MQSTIKFIIQTLGADEGSRELAKLERAAKKAGLALEKYVKTPTGSAELVSLQKRAAIAREQALADKERERAANQATTATDRASRSQAGYFGHIARTTVQSALINQLFLQFVDVASQAVQQVDLMNNFPATMRSMGESTEEANTAMNTLRDYVGQVGGNLGDATSYVTRFTGAIGDVKAATAVFVGLNNALIAGDSSLEEQRQAAIQFAQALERGKPDLREWRTLTQNMSFQLDQVAKSMGYVNANELGEALSQGEESMAAFTTALTKMSTGTGPIAEQARARMNGMQFSFNVMKNTLVQGLAAIIDTIGRENIVSFFSFLTQVIKVLTQVVITLIGWIVTLLNLLGSLFGLPAIKLKKNMEGVADGLGSGAGAAEDMGDGLKDANDEAKKLNKSLAAFDKMNVLPDKTSGKDKDEGGTGPGFDTGQIGELGDLFGEIGGDLENISKWAKIFAGIIAGLVGIKFAQAILGELAKVTEGFKAASKITNSFKDAMKSGSFAGGKEAGQKIGTEMKTGLLDSFKSVSGLLGGILGGAISALGPVIGGAFAGLAGAIGISVGALVAIVAAAVAVIIIVILTIKDNWDTIVNGMKKVWETFTDVLKALWEPAVESLNKSWDKFYEVIRPGVEKIQELFKKLGDFLAPIWKKITDAVSPFIDKIKELYQKFVQPLIDKFKEWAAESGTLMAILKVFGIIITVIVLAPLAAVVAAIGLVVIAFVALASAIVWVISKIVEFVTYVVTGGLWEDIQALIGATAQWFQDKFNEAVEFVKGIFSGIGEWFKINVWDKIVAIFTGTGTWFRDRFQEAWNFITAIWNYLGDFFKERWENLKANLAMVGTWFKERFQEAWNNVVAIWGALGDWFKQRWENLKTNLASIGSWFREKFQDAWNGITNIFNNVGNWFKTNVVDKIVNAFSGIKDKITGFFGGVWDGLANGLKNALNSLLNLPLKIPSVTVAGKTIGGQTLIPRLARGGIIDQATLAVVGESGAEAVVPLENNLEWIDKLAAKINTGSGNSKQPVQITVQIGEEKIASQIIDLINEKTQMSGRNTIYV